MGAVGVVGLVVAGVVIASVLCLTAIGIAVGWVRRRPANHAHGEHPRGTR
ncbi:hypothetical protein [Mycobacterium helveticum]|jgi:branched-subunit amino acid ABC-type transport system permease component|nr:hypothetical protein [Mycobacterium helveticum]